MNKSISTWWRALRAYSFSATVIPVTCGFLFAGAVGEPVDWPFYPLMLCSALLLHAAVNLLNDYYDYILGFDTSDALGSSGLLTEGVVPPTYMLLWGRIYFAGGALSGLFLVVTRGWPLLAIGFAGTLGAWFYSHRFGYKYKGLGELFVFLLMGPLLFFAAAYAANQTVSLLSTLPAVACGCLVTAILLLNNLRDIEMDSAAGFTTLPMRLGIRRSKQLYTFLLLAPFIVPCILLLLAGSRVAVLLPLVIFPAAILHLRTVWRTSSLSQGPTLAPEVTAAIYLLFGILFCIGVFLSRAS